jgi:hypothetical protein
LVPKGGITEELDRNLPKVPAEVTRRVTKQEVAAVGDALAPDLARRSRSL